MNWFRSKLADKNAPGGELRARPKNFLFLLPRISLPETLRDISIRLVDAVQDCRTHLFHKTSMADHLTPPYINKDPVHPAQIDLEQLFHAVHHLGQAYIAIIDLLGFI